MHNEHRHKPDLQKVKLLFFANQACECDHTLRTLHRQPSTSQQPSMHCTACIWPCNVIEVWSYAHAQNAVKSSKFAQKNLNLIFLRSKIVHMTTLHTHYTVYRAQVGSQQCNTAPV